MVYLITCLDKKHEKHEKHLFSCGNKELDEYLQTQASQDLKKNVAVIYALTAQESRLILGYYSLSSITILPNELPNEAIKKLPKYSLLPAILLGRLAVDENYQGNRIGEFLLLDAIKRSIDISKQIGVIALIVHAKNKSAASFYQRYNFIKFPDHPKKLFLPIKTAKMLF